MIFVILFSSSNQAAASSTEQQRNTPSTSTQVATPESDEPSTSLLSRKRKRQEEASTALFPLKKRRLMNNARTEDHGNTSEAITTEASPTLQDTTTNIQSSGSTIGPESSPSPPRNQQVSTAIGNSANSANGGSVRAASGISLDQLAVLKLKLKQDYDKFVEQVGQLASLERQKNTLIQKFVQLCTAASLSTTNGTSTTGVNPNNTVYGSASERLNSTATSDRSVSEESNSSDGMVNERNVDEHSSYSSSSVSTTDTNSQ